MKRRLGMFGVTLLAVCAIFSARVRSQDDASQPPRKKDAVAATPGKPSPAEMAEMMKKYMQSMRPGPNHKRLDCFVGDWKTTTRIWQGGPGSSPSESKGRAKIRWVLGGRFLLEEFEGELMIPDEQGRMQPVPFQGMGLTGYDNVRNLYTTSWADNMGTQQLAMRGAADPSGKVFTYYGEMDEPMLNVYGRTVKYVTRIVDKDTHVFSIFDLHAGDNYKVMETTYSRS